MVKISSVTAAAILVVLAVFKIMLIIGSPCDRLEEA